MPKPMRDLTGQRFGRLVVQRRVIDTWRGQRRPFRERNWLCLCDCGATKIVPGPALHGSNTRSCGCLLRETNSRKRVEVPTYISYHQRLRRDRGDASNYACVDCGESAQEWSYDHLDPIEYEHEYMPGVRYSVRDEHYHPRCKKCHRGFDKKLAAQRDEARVFYA